MEHFELALRKAREQRAATAPQRESAHIPNIVGPAAVTYSQTPTIQTDPAALERNRVIAVQLSHPVTDVYRALRAQVLQRLAKLNKSTLGITSTGPGEGKTVTAINLAIAIAADTNQTVLLVDADLRNPRVASALGIRPERGLLDYLAGRAGIPDCLFSPGRQRLTILPSRDRVGNSAELLSSPQMAHLAQELKNRYPDRVIIYDLPPLLTSGDALAFLPSVESTMLVVREGVARAADLERAKRILSDHDYIGAVLNAAE